MATTPNRNYPLPVPSNPVRDDVARLISAFEAIDGDVAGLLAALATKAAVNHGHSLADIAGLVDALNGKAAVGHTHSLAGLSDVSITGAPVGRPLTTQAGGTVGIGPDWSAEIAGKVSAADVQAHRNDVSWGADLVRVDGAHAAVLANHVNYYGATSGRNIDEVEAGDVGLYSTSNPGTWPPGGTTFWFVTTQRLYTGQAVLQRAVSYASGAPGTGDGFEFIRLRGNGGVWSSWRKVFHEDAAGKLTVERAAPGAETAVAIRNLSGAAGSLARLDLSVDQPNAYGIFYLRAGSAPTLIVSTGAGVTGGYEINVGYAAAPVRIKQADITRLEVDADGNVVVPGAFDAASISIAGSPLRPSLLTAEYESAPTSVALSTTYTFAHGLGVKPKFVIFSAYCYNSAGTYAYYASVGDEARCDNPDGTPVPWWADETNVYVPFGPESTGNLAFRMTTGSLVRMYLPNPALAGNWKLKVRAYG